MEQSWPGCPWAGLVPAATEPGTTGMGRVGAGKLGEVDVFVLDLAGAFNGVPTGISQRCRGIPCAGFKATAVVGKAAWFAGAVIGTVFIPLVGKVTGDVVFTAPVAGFNGVVLVVFLVLGPQLYKTNPAATSRRNFLFFIKRVLRKE